MSYTSFDIQKKNSPIITLALHDGHYISPEVLPYMNLAEHERFREEDPYTAFMADLPVSKVIVNTSRFFVDLNRLKDKAIYKNPEDAWGLQVWKNGFPEILVKELMEYYEKFYKATEQLIEDTIQKFGYFLILDIHSYNHRRESPDKTAPEIDNPEINIGTAFNHPKWQALSKSFMEYLSNCSIGGKYPDVRENIVFKGGGLSQWFNSKYGEKGSIISVEFKKTFMDEWTGRANIDHILEIKEALLGSIPLLKAQLNKLTEHKS